MKKLAISRKHNLTQLECKLVAQGLLDKLVGSYGGIVKDAGDDLEYEHPAGVKALVESRHDCLNVNIEFGLFSSALAPKLETEVNRVLDKYIS